MRNKLIKLAHDSGYLEKRSSMLPQAWELAKPWLEAGGIGAASHLALNGVYGGLSRIGQLKPKSGILKKITGGIGNWWHGVEQNQFASGVHDAIAGNPPTIFQRFSETAAGPESQAARGLGRQVGEQLRNVPEAEHEAHLKNIKNSLADLIGKNPELAHTPIFSTIHGGIGRALDNGLPIIRDARPEGLLSRATPGLTTAALGVVDGPAAAHGVLNMARSRIPSTATGKAFFTQDAKEGLARAQPGWEIPKKTRAIWKATDIGLSPMARDLSRATEGLSRAAQNSPEEAKRLHNALEGVTNSLPDTHPLKQMQAASEAKVTAPAESGGTPSTILQAGRRNAAAQAAISDHMSTVPGYWGFQGTLEGQRTFGQHRLRGRLQGNLQGLRQEAGSADGQQRLQEMADKLPEFLKQRHPGNPQA